MNVADTIYNDIIKDIKENGAWDTEFDVRPKYADGTPAYTKAVFGRQYEFDANTIPLLTSKKMFPKTAIKEMLLFWVKQTVKEYDFKSVNCKVWDEWFLPDRTLGKSYAYQFESRPYKKIVTVKSRYVDYQGTKSLIDKDDNIYTAKNYSDVELVTLKSIWNNMFTKYEYIVCDEWYSFDTFLKDIRYIPQFFIAQQNNFAGWDLNNLYYFTNIYSKDTSVFYPTNEDVIISDNSNIRYELSRNQVVELLHNIKHNPSSRRLMTSFWNYNDVNDKALQECAYSTQWNIRNNTIDLILKQRSGDSGLGVPFNWFQYKILQLLIAKVSNLKVGKFIHQIGDIHYYDRHEQLLLDQTSNETYTPPEIIIKDVNDFFNITADDIEIINYKSNNYIPMEVAI